MFKSTKITMGSSPLRYRKPTRGELAKLKDNVRTSAVPFGTIKNSKSKRKSRGYGYSDFAKDLRAYRGYGADHFSSFGSTYNPSSHLGKNLTIKL